MARVGSVCGGLAVVVECLCEVRVEAGYLLLCGVSHAARLGWFALRSLSAHFEGDFHQKVVAVKSRFWRGVHIVDKVAPCFVNERMVQLDLVAIGTGVCVCSDVPVLSASRSAERRGRARQ